MLESRNSLQAEPLRSLLERLHADARGDRLKFLTLAPRLLAGWIRRKSFAEIITPEAMKEFYTPEQLQKIVTRSAGLLAVQLDAPAAQTIAERSRGTARVVNRLLRRVRDYSQVMSDGAIDADISDEALAALGVDEMGLDDLDR